MRRQERDLAVVARCGGALARMGLRWTDPAVVWVMNRFGLFVIVVLVGIVSGCAVLRPDLPVGEKVDFERHIKPILEDRCVQCHNRQSMPDGVSFETRKLALMSGGHGSAIIPGDPDSSRLLNFINAPRGTAVAMPREGHDVSVEEVETLREWIAAGASWPGGPEGTLVPRN